jgi:hypothetical protein
MGKASRDKGGREERMLVRILQAAGFAPNECRSLVPHTAASVVICPFHSSDAISASSPKSAPTVSANSTSGCRTTTSWLCALIGVGRWSCCPASLQLKSRTR